MTFATDLQALKDSITSFAAKITTKFNNYILISKIGAANGVAPLNASSQIPSQYLPSYVDDVLEFANVAAFPATGESGKIYVDLSAIGVPGQSTQYRWSGSAYQSLVQSPGSTDSLAEGTVNLYFTTARAAAAAPVKSVAGKTGVVTLVAGDISGLSTVATTGSYSDLLNKPTIPTQTSQLTNNNGFITAAGAPVQSVAGLTGSITSSGLKTALAYTSAEIIAALGFTPIQQGGGTGQGANKIYIGWGSGAYANKLALQVDSTDFGVTWPINVSGNAATATTASSANSVAWSNVSGRPTTVSSFTNDSGYITSGGAPVQSVAGQTGAISAANLKSALGITIADVASLSTSLAAKAGTDGSGASGTWGINISGSSASAGYATSAGTANALNTTNSYQVKSLGVGTGASATTGQILATDDVIAFYSDERLKDILGKIENAIESVLSLDTIIYRPNRLAVDFGFEPDHTYVGLKAGQVEKVQPFAVHLAPFDTEVLEDGTVVSKSGQNYKTVQYERLVPLLVQAFTDEHNANQEMFKKIFATLSQIQETIRSA